MFDTSEILGMQGAEAMAFTGTGLIAAVGAFTPQSTKPGRTRSADDWTESVMRRVISIADSTPSFVRDQAQGFADRIRQVIRDNLAGAVHEERLACARIAELAGHPEIASVIRSRQ